MYNLWVTQYLCLKVTYRPSAVGLSQTPSVYELAYRYRAPPYTYIEHSIKLKGEEEAKPTPPNYRYSIRYSSKLT